MNKSLHRRTDLFNQILSVIVLVTTFSILFSPYGAIIQVRAETAEKTIPRRTNLALNKKATQSSTALGAPASRAVDGVTDGNWNKNSVTHTNAEYRPWWQVDLGAAYDISEIKIYNRTDCCQERLDKFWVVYSDSKIINNGTAANGTRVKSYASTGPWGASTQNPRVMRENAKKVRYIRIYLTGSNFLHLAEVEVYGTNAQNTAATTTTSASLEQQCYNAVLGKVAYNRTGSTGWAPSNVKKLCKGTTNVANTISCFKNEVQAHNSWSRGVNACKVNPTVARATVTKTNNTAVKIANRSATTKRPSPLTPNQMSKVMQWIAVKTSAARMPFCYRKSKGRGFGKIPQCPTGYVKEGLVCFTPCKANEKGVDGYCYRNCPAGFRNDGLYCGKPGAKTRESFPWKPGDPLLPNYSGPTRRCEAKYGKGKCERGGALIFPKCGTGFKPVASGSVCTPICPSGYTDIGVSCKKPTSRRLVTYANTCPAGLVKDKTGDICYPTCKSVTGRNDFTGVGPVCWQNCPSQQKTDCGVGCATSKGACAKSVISMTTSPIIAALKIAALVATFGGSSAATGSAGAAVGGGKLVSKLPRLKKLFDMADSLKRAAATYKTTIKAVTTTKTVVNALKNQTELFATEFSKHFGEMTSPEIEKVIDDRFSREAALEIKKEWGRHHVGLMMEANAIDTAYNVLSVAGIADPTGLVGVVSAFTNPLCRDDTPFPTVNPKY